jgi:hypothetical protein
VSESVHRLLQTSLDTGVIPKQWKVAKIIPLKKPNKVTSNHEHPKVRAIYVVGLTSMVKDNELGSFVCFNLFEMDVNFGM